MQRAIGEWKICYIWGINGPRRPRVRAHALRKWALHRISDGWESKIKISCYLMASHGIMVRVHGTISWTSWACFEILVVIACKRAYRVAFHCQFSTRWFCDANAIAHVRKPSTAPHPWSYEMLDSLNALVQRFRSSFKHHQQKVCIHIGMGLRCFKAGTRLRSVQQLALNHTFTKGLVTVQEVNL